MSLLSINFNYPGAFKGEEDKGAIKEMYVKCRGIYEQPNPTVSVSTVYLNGDIITGSL